MGGRSRGRWVAAVVVLVLLSLAARSLDRAWASSDRWALDLHTVGTDCPGAFEWVCGSIEVPFDRAKPSAGSLTVRFRVLPRLDFGLPSAGTLVVVNGGPGESTIAQSGFVARAFAPLRHDHDILLVDNRGSGASEAIDCPAAQKTFSDAAVAECRARLGSHADDYGTIAAVDDLDAVLRRIHAQDVDLYGESYGTFFAQVFAIRHPQHLRRLVLDGPAPLDQNPFRADSLPAGLAGLRITCRADPGCSALGDPSALLRTALVELAIDARAEGARRALGLLIAGAGHKGSAYRELPAALRSYLDGDRLPLVRLLNEAFDDGAGSADASATESAGLLLADMCTDYPMPFDLRAPLAVQRRQLASAKAREDSSAARVEAAAPLRPSDGFLDPSECLGWPAPDGRAPWELARRLPDVPTLVLEGALDSVTPAPGAHEVASEFAHARYVEVPFVGHVTALRDETGCAGTIAAEFLANTDVDESCLRAIPAPTTIASFPIEFSDVAPLARADTRSTTGARVLAVARDALADVIWRWEVLDLASGRGLRGGTFSTRAPRGLVLDGVSWTIDTTVSGTLSFGNGEMAGDLEVATPAGRATLQVRSADVFGRNSVERLTGTVGGDAVDATVPTDFGI